MRNAIPAVVAFWAFVSTPLWSCAKDLGKLSGRYSLYQAARSEALTKLQSRDSLVTDVQVKRSGLNYEVVIHRADQPKAVNGLYFDPLATGDSFVYDVTVPVAYQELGLNKLLVSKFLADNPQVTGAKLNLYDVNLDAFFDDMTKGDRGPTGCRLQPLRNGVSSTESEQ